MKKIFSLLSLLAVVVFLTPSAKGQGCTENPTLGMQWAFWLVDHSVDPSNVVHICAGEHVNLSVQISPMDYDPSWITWSTGGVGKYIEPVYPGQYYYTITYPSGCAYASQMVTVLDDAVPSELVMVSNTNNLLTVTNASSFENFRWYYGNQPLYKPDGSYVTGSTYQMKRPGTYSVRATKDGCNVMSSSFTFKKSVILVRTSADVVLSPGERIVAIIDVTGRQMPTKIEALHSGMYMVTLENAGKQKSMQIQKE